MNLDEFTTIEQLAAALKSLDMVTAVPWTDYSGTSTIVGWTSYTTKQLNYKKIGTLVFVQMWLDGTSNNIATTFTLPFAAVAANFGGPIRIMDNGTYALGIYTLPGSSSLVTVLPAPTGGTWTASGTKRVLGEFWYVT